MKKLVRNLSRLSWCTLGVFCSLCCAVPDPAENLADGHSSQGPVIPNSAEATRVDNAPKLDGTLDDPLWQSAKLITDFHQREPHEGEPATEKTEVRIL